MGLQLKEKPSGQANVFSERAYQPRSHCFNCQGFLEKTSATACGTASATQNKTMDEAMFQQVGAGRGRRSLRLDAMNHVVLQLHRFYYDMLLLHFGFFATLDS